MVFAIVQKNVLTLRSCMLKYTRLKSWFSEKRKYTERRVVKHLELLNSNEECTLLQYFSGFENVQKLKKKKSIVNFFRSKNDNFVMQEYVFNF